MCPFFRLSSDKILGSLQESFTPYDRYKWSFSGARRNGLEMGNLGLEPYLGVFTPLRTGRGPSCSSSKGHANWLFPIWTSTGFLEMNLRQKSSDAPLFLGTAGCLAIFPAKTAVMSILTPENSGFKQPGNAENESTPRAPTSDFS